MKTYYVNAVRFGHGRFFASYRLGPFRSRLWARFIAWLETSGTRGQGWSQQAEVVE